MAFDKIFVKVEEGDFEVLTVKLRMAICGPWGQFSAIWFIRSELAGKTVVAKCQVISNSALM